MSARDSPSFSIDSNTILCLGIFGLGAMLKILRTPELHARFESILKSLAPHFPSIAEAALMGGLAYVGYSKFGLEGALLGPVSLKLATAPGGTIPVSQTAGLIGLGLLGLSFQKSPDILPPDLDNKCPEGYKLNHNLLYGWHCVKLGMPDI